MKELFGFVVIFLCAFFGPAAVVLGLLGLAELILGRMK